MIYRLDDYWENIEVLLLLWDSPPRCELKLFFLLVDSYGLLVGLIILVLGRLLQGASL